MSGYHILVEKHTTQTGELFRILRRQILACATATAADFHLRMPPEIILKTLCHDLALTHHADSFGNPPAYFAVKKRIMRAGKHYRVERLIALKQPAYILVDKIIRTVAVSLQILHQRHPHRASLDVTL